MPSPPSWAIHYHPSQENAWIQYHAIQDPTGFWLNWDPTDPDDIKLLQEYVESN